MLCIVLKVCEPNRLSFRFYLTNYFVVFFFLCKGENYLIQVMEGALKNAMMNDVEFRKGIPIDFFDYNGVQNIDEVF